MAKIKLSVLFVADSTIFSILASQCISQLFSDVRVVFYEHGEYPKPSLDDWEGDWIISFKSDLILSDLILKRANRGCINIHPAPPKYRGIGGYSWAVGNNDTSYGVTCHHMVSKIDAGPIILVRRFPLLTGETPTTLKMRTSIYCLQVLNDLLPIIACNKELPLSDEIWGEKLYTYNDLEFIGDHL